MKPKAFGGIAQEVLVNFISIWTLLAVAGVVV
ncbi:unnamed protein product, partial [marine sediment metagenome]